MVVTLGDKTSVEQLYDSEVVVSDSTSVKTIDAVRVTLDAKPISVRPELAELSKQVTLSDSYQVVPFAKRITTDFTLPTYITEGLFADIDDVNKAILDEVDNREIAVIDSINYSKTYTDGVQEQIYTDISANYISNEAGENYVLASHLTNMELTFDTASGAVTSTLQDIYSTATKVGDAQAGYDENLQQVVTDINATANRTTTLEADVDGLDIRLDTVEGVAAGQFTVWYDENVEPLIGMIKFTTVDGIHREVESDVTPTDIQWQYLGGTLGEGADGWVQSDASAAGTATTAYGWAAGASQLITGDDGSITGWSFGDGSNVASTFKINADNFAVSSADGETQPLSIVVDDAGNVKTAFTGQVSFSEGTGHIGSEQLEDVTVPSDYSGTIICKTGIIVYEDGVPRVEIGLL
jgi:hypothetical protein